MKYCPCVQQSAAVMSDESSVRLSSVAVMASVTICRRICVSAVSIPGSLDGAVQSAGRNSMKTAGRCHGCS